MYRISQYREQYRANLKLALPVVMTQLGQILVQMADNMMVGRYGGDDPTPLAATSFGGTAFFLLFIAAIGVTMGLTPLVGELYARGDRQRSSQYLQNGVMFFSLLGVATCALQLLVIPLLYHMGQPTEVVDMSIPYYRMLAYSMIPVMIFYSFKQFLEGVGNTRVEMVVVILCNLLNVLLNWIFIFGHFGVEAMGATGAGLATLVSRCCMPVLIVGYFFWREKYRVYLDGFSLRNYSGATVRSLLRMGIPISSQMFLESSAFVGTSIMMGWLGKTAISANQIAMTMGNCAFMIVTSIGAATTIRVSHCYGARNVGELTLAAKASYHLVVLWNLLAAAIFISMSEVIPGFFTSNREVIDLASKLLLLIAVYQLADGVQNVSVGVLRGIQDVKIIMPIAFLSYIVFNLPVGYLLGFRCGMGAQGLILGFTVGLTIAAVLMIARIRRDLRRWRWRPASR